jgi:hypothetical protein
MNGAPRQGQSGRRWVGLAQRSAGLFTESPGLFSTWGSAVLCKAQLPPRALFRALPSLLVCLEAVTNQLL